MQCACAILSSVSCPTLQYFSTLSHRRHDFREEEIIENGMRGLIFSTNLSRKFLIIRIIERDMMKNAYWPSCKVPVKCRFKSHLPFAGIIRSSPYSPH